MRGVIAALVVMVAAVAGVAALAIAFGAFAGNEGDGIERVPMTIVAANGSTARLHIEIADTPEERSVGLSGRTEIPNDTGMLFTSLTRNGGFWMKDTLVDLSVAFLDKCGKIVHIEDMEANTTTNHNSPTPYLFGLETPKGWFAKNGIAVGDIVSIPEEHRQEGC
jgi:uncharacterized membrane protein (UPF0127 family)